MTEVQFYVVVPARYASSRLPAKPLLNLAGKPMVIHVVERALASNAVQVIVATDHAEIHHIVQQHGYQSVMTSMDHPSGTDRIAEVANIHKWDDETIVVNVQGDEPLINYALINQVAENLAANPEAQMATACHQINDKASMLNPNVVKVVMDEQGYALYFSRAPIPYPRDIFSQGNENIEGLGVNRHVGIYAYRVGFLKAYCQLIPTTIERLESLEQLRVLSYGYKISVCKTPDVPEGGVDTEDDLHRVRAILSKQPNDL